MIVDIARLPRHDHFVLQPGGIGKTLHALGVRAGDAGGGGMSERCGATRRHDAPFRLGHLGEAPADAVHEFVQVDIVP